MDAPSIRFLRDATVAAFFRRSDDSRAGPHERV
jgi:hypothetical protein